LATFQHPATLNPLQQYLQACAILRNTTRASNPAWYQEALELDFQLHLRPDGPAVSAFYHDRKKNLWIAASGFTEETLEDPAKLESFIADTLKYCRSQGATSLGVVLHIADEFATTELKPEFDNPGALPDLRDAAIHDPASILEDSSISSEQASWRVVPYPAAGAEVIGTTITLTRGYAPFFDSLRQAGERENFPIIPQALSAPLVALMGLSTMVRPTPGKPFVAILQYPWFTVLAFFNEHADLRLIRTLQHRGTRRATNFRNALTTTSASLEFLDPDLFIIPLGEDVDNSLETNLRGHFTHHRVECIQPPHPDGLPAWCPEPAISTLSVETSAEDLTSNTFSTLRDEKWALQNFIRAPREVVEIHPSRNEMRMLRMLRLGRVALFAFAILCAAYFLFGIVDLVRRPEWAFNPAEAGATQMRLSKLNTERQAADHWSNLLEDRSKAWIAMESLARMFPDQGGMLAKNFSHSSKPDSTAGQAKIGFIKEWKISGFAREEALDYLNTLNTREGINAHFSEIARITGNEAYNPVVGNRNISVNVRTQENSGFKPIPFEESIVSDESSYPFTFELSITQRFESTDPLAITVPKAP
jgi:hypothetical protein